MFSSPHKNTGYAELYVVAKAYAVGRALHLAAYL